jgi:mannose-6-phosphate isomerase-like protein (cupin superfamily)
MLDLIKNAKENSHAVLFEQYQIPEITWEDIMNFVYKESIIKNDNLKKKVEQVNNLTALDYIGNIQIQEKFWLAPQTHNIFEDFKGVSELLYKLNNSVDNRHCGYYNQGQHNCNSDWHFQGIRMSLSNRNVSDHHDPHDIFYWQIVGTSFWKIDGGTTYELRPGDMLYLPLENSHEVWCDGPRAGLLIDNLN